MHNGYHVFVVDDEPDFRATTAALLAMEGFRVTEASDGFDALRRLSHNDVARVDAFLIDFRMPGLNGGETLQRIRAAGVSGCAILVSASADLERLAKQFLFDDSVRKPCDLEEVLAAIHRCIGQAGTRTFRPE
jgi:CheY-like chemotaxis protein